MKITTPRELPPRVEVDPDLVALYMEETKQSERIVSAFVAFDLEPPHRDKTTKIGFSTFENKVLAETAIHEPSYIDMEGI